MTMSDVLSYHLTLEQEGDERCTLTVAHLLDKETAIVQKLLHLGAKLDDAVSHTITELVFIDTERWLHFGQSPLEVLHLSSSVIP